MVPPLLHLHQNASDVTLCPPPPPPPAATALAFAPGAIRRAPSPPPSFGPSLSLHQDPHISLESTLPQHSPSKGGIGPASFENSVDLKQDDHQHHFHLRNHQPRHDYFSSDMTDIHLPDQDDLSFLLIPPPLDKGWRAWAVVAGSVLIQTFAFAPTEFIFGVFEQEYLMVFSSEGTTPSAVALVGTIGTSTTYLVGFLSGACASRFGYRSTACVGALIMALALVLASFATKVWHLCLTHGILFGCGSSLAYFSAIAAPSAWFVKSRGLAMGIAASGSGLGGFVLAPLTQFLADRVGIFWTLRILAMYSLVVCGIGGYLLFEREDDLDQRDKGKEELDQTLHKELATVKSKVAEIFRVPSFSKEVVFWVLVAFEFCLSMAYLTPIYFMEMYSTHIGMSMQMGAVINGWFNGASFLARIFSGLLADLIRTEVVLLTSIWTSAFSVLVLWTFSKTFPLYLTFAILYGAFFSGTSTVMPVMVANFYGPHLVSSVLGLVYGFCCAALLCGSFISGQLLEMSKPTVDYLPVIMYSGGMFTASAFFATLWVILMIKSQKRAAASSSSDEGHAELDFYSSIKG